MTTFRFRWFGVSSLLTVLAAMTSAAILGAYLHSWELWRLDYQLMPIGAPPNTERMLFFGIFLAMITSLAGVAAFLRGAPRRVMLAAALASFTANAFLQTIALDPIGSWLSLSALLALLAVVAATLDGSVPRAKALRAYALGVAIGLVLLGLSAVVGSRLGP